MAENKSNMSYDTMLEILIQNMKQLAGNTTSSCNVITNTHSILLIIKDKIEKDTKLSEDVRDMLIMQFDELFNSIEENNNGFFTSLSFLKEQLGAYRIVCQKLKEAGILNGDMSTSMSFVEKSLLAGEKKCQKPE